MKTRVLLVDHHAMVRQGLKRILEHDAGVLVVGEAIDGFEAVKLTQSEEPDVILIELSTSPGCGLAGVEQVVHRFPRASVLVLSENEEPSRILEVIRAGARGYLAKSESAEELTVAIDTLRAGRIYLSAEVASEVIAALADTSSRSDPFLANLTLREREVMLHTVEGSSSREIGALLDISPRTVEKHRAHLMKKLGVRKAADLIRIAIREGLVDV